MKVIVSMVKRARTKKDEVLSVLRQEIFDQVWKIGDNLPNEQELAQRFGCSTGTVNKALGIVAHEGLITRRNRLGTRVISNSLKSENNKALDLDSMAFVFPDEQHEGIWRTLRGFQEAARSEGRRVVMLSTGLDYHQETEVLARLAEFDVRGAVVFPIVPTIKAQMDFLKVVTGSKFPIVLVELNLPGITVPSVMVDGFHAGYTMTKHLLDRGLTRIGYFSNYVSMPFMRDRYQGYRWALQEAGLTEPAGAVHLEPFIELNLDDPVTGSLALAKKFVEPCNKLEGVVCGNDFLALALVRQLAKKGIRVPQDILVTGVDDFLGSSGGPVQLTTYRVPYEEMGAQAFAALNSTGRRHGAPLETFIRGKIVLRESA